MRIAVLADIHANRVALATVVEAVDALRPDAVLVLGDTINRGPRPLECLQRIEEFRRDRGWRLIRGNHEDYVISESRPREGRPDWETKLCRLSGWTLSKVRPHLADIEAWGDRLDLADGVVCMHASRRGNRVGLYPLMSDCEMEAMIDPAAAVFCVGHTHLPFVRQVGSTLVVNAGAVGHPFDGDPRAAFAVLEKSRNGWHAEIRRLDYDRAAAERDYHDSGFLANAGPMAPLVLREFHKARPMLSHWHHLFEHLVAGNQITIEASVEELLTSP